VTIAIVLKDDLVAEDEGNITGKRSYKNTLVLTLSITET